MTLDEAAKVLGVRWRAVRREMIALGWVIQVDRDRFLTTFAAAQAGYVQPITEALPQGYRPSRVIETGYLIGAKGLRVLRGRFRP